MPIKRYHKFGLITFQADKKAHIYGDSDYHSQQ